MKCDRCQRHCACRDLTLSCFKWREVTSRRRSSLDVTHLNRRTGVRCGLRHVDPHFQSHFPIIFQSCRNVANSFKQDLQTVLQKVQLIVQSSSNISCSFISCHFQCFACFACGDRAVAPQKFSNLLECSEEFFAWEPEQKGHYAESITRMHARLTSDAARCPKHVGRILVRVSVIVQS